MLAANRRGEGENNCNIANEFVIQTVATSDGKELVSMTL